MPGSSDRPGQTTQRNRRSMRTQMPYPQSQIPQDNYRPVQGQSQWPSPPPNLGFQQPVQPIRPQRSAQPVPPVPQDQPMQQSYYQPPQPAYSTQGYVPPAPPPVSGGSGKPPKPPKKKKSGILGILIAILVLAALGAGIAGVAQINQEHIEQQQALNYVASYDNVFCQGVYVDGISLGGMTWEEAESAVSAQAMNRHADWYLRLVYKGHVVTEIRNEHLGKSVDITQALTDAWAQGHTGTAQERLVAMEAMLTQPFYAYTAESGGSTGQIDQVLQVIQDGLYQAPRDAQLLGFDPLATSDPFTISPDVPGQQVNVEALREQINQMVSTMTSGELEIVPEPIYASVTTEDIRKTVSLRASVYTRIATSSTKDRTSNIRKALEYMDGTVLEPGATFSFNKAVGERTIERGFFSAIEYAYGEMTKGVGGGVCQASSTVYIAAVEAGLQIVKREQHSMKVNYTDYGKDATVNLDGKKIDLTFKNNTEGKIYIVCSLQSDPDNRHRQVARVSIYGMALGEGVRYALETETVEVLPIPAEPVKKKDKNAEYVTYTDQTHTKKGEEGYVVKSYRVLYLNGVEQERKELYTDTYKAQPTTIYTGVKERTKK